MDNRIICWLVDLIKYCKEVDIQDPLLHVIPNKLLNCGEIQQIYKLLNQGEDSIWDVLMEIVSILNQEGNDMYDPPSMHSKNHGANKPSTHIAVTPCSKSPLPLSAETNCAYDTFPCTAKPYCESSPSPPSAETNCARDTFPCTAKPYCESSPSPPSAETNCAHDTFPCTAKPYCESSPSPPSAETNCVTSPSTLIATTQYANNHLLSIAATNSLKDSSPLNAETSNLSFLSAETRMEDSSSTDAHSIHNLTEECEQSDHKSYEFMDATDETSSPPKGAKVLFAVILSLFLLIGGVCTIIHCTGRTPLLNSGSPASANKTSTALTVLPGITDNCPIPPTILPSTFGNLMKFLELHHRAKVYAKVAKLWEYNCDMKHEVQRHLATHQTEKESLLAIPSRPRIYNYSVCSMRDVPPILTCHPWEAPTTRMCPAPDITNSTNSTTVHVDTKPLGVFVATPCLTMYLLRREWKPNTITSVLILLAPPSKPPAILSEQKPMKPPKPSTPGDVRENGNTTDDSAPQGFESTSFLFWPWFYFIAICLLYKFVVTLQYCVKWVVYRRYFLVTVEELLLCFVNYHFQLLYSNATMIVHFLSFTLYTWVRCYLHRGRTTITETQKQNKEPKTHNKVQLPSSDLITGSCEIVSSAAKNSQAEVDELNGVESNSSSSDEPGIAPHVGEPGSTTTKFLPPSCKVPGSASVDSTSDMTTPEDDEISNNGSSSNTDHSLKEISTDKQHCKSCNHSMFTSTENLPLSYPNDLAEECSELSPIDVSRCSQSSAPLTSEGTQNQPLSTNASISNASKLSTPENEILNSVSDSHQEFSADEFCDHGSEMKPDKGPCNLSPHPVCKKTVGQFNLKAQTYQTELLSSSNLEICITFRHQKEGERCYLQRKPLPLSHDPPKPHPCQTVLLGSSNLKTFRTSHRQKKGGKSHPQRKLSPLSMTTSDPLNRKVQPYQALLHSSILKAFGTSHHRKKGRKSRPYCKRSSLSLNSNDSQKLQPYQALPHSSILKAFGTSRHQKKGRKFRPYCKRSSLSLNSNDSQKLQPYQALPHSSILKAFGTSCHRKKGRKSHPQQKPSPLSMAINEPPNRKVQPYQVDPHSSSLSTCYQKKGGESCQQCKPPFSLATYDPLNHSKPNRTILQHPFDCHRKKRGKPRPWNISPDRKLNSPPLYPGYRPTPTDPFNHRLFSLPRTRNQRKRYLNNHYSRITRRVFLTPTKDVPPVKLQPKHPSRKKDPPRHFPHCTKHEVPSRENSHNWKGKEMDSVDNDGGASSQSSPGSGGQSGNGGSQHKENGEEREGGEGGGGGREGGREGGGGGGEDGGKKGRRDHHGNDDDDESSQTEEDTGMEDSGLGPSLSASSVPSPPASPPRDPVKNSETVPIVPSLMVPVQPCDKPPDPKPPPHPPPSGTMDAETQPTHKTEAVRHRKERPRAEDSVQEWDREKEGQVCPNTHTIHPRLPEMSEECNKGPQHTLKPSLFFSNITNTGGGSIVDSELTNPPAKVSDEHGQQSTIVLSLSDVIENEFGDDSSDATEEESLEDTAIQTAPPKSPDIQKTLVPEPSEDLLSCSISIKPRQTHLSLLPSGSGSCTVCVERCLPTWVGKPVLVQERFQQELNEQLHGVQLSQEENGESKGVVIESEEGRNKPARVNLPPRPVCPFYMRPPSRDDNPISLPDLREFRSSMEARFLDFDTPSPQYMEPEMQNN